MEWNLCGLELLYVCCCGKGGVCNVLLGNYSVESAMVSGESESSHFGLPGGWCLPGIKYDRWGNFYHGIIFITWTGRHPYRL